MRRINLFFIGTILVSLTACSDKTIDSTSPTTLSDSVNAVARDLDQAERDQFSSSFKYLRDVDERFIDTEMFDRDEIINVNKTMFNSVVHGLGADQVVALAAETLENESAAIEQNITETLVAHGELEDIHMVTVEEFYENLASISIDSPKYEINLDSDFPQFSTGKVRFTVFNEGRSPVVKVKIAAELYRITASDGSMGQTVIDHQFFDPIMPGESREVSIVLDSYDPLSDWDIIRAVGSLDRLRIKLLDVNAQYGEADRAGRTLRASKMNVDAIVAEFEARRSQLQELEERISAQGGEGSSF